MNYIYTKLEQYNLTGSIKDRVAYYIIKEAYKEALTKNELVPVCEPKMDVKEIDKDHVKFVFTIITKPEVKLGKYKGLKAKKTYHVRVRTYKTVSGKKYYSGWSTYKSAKTK